MTAAITPTREKPLPLLTDLEDCHDCEGSGECWECSGTGDCSSCKGGKAESARAFCNALYWENGIQQRCDRRAPKWEGETWQCEEHQRQAEYLAKRGA